MTRDERTPSGTTSFPACSSGGAPRWCRTAWTSACSPRTAARREAREPWWSRLFTASVRVPLPVAVGVLMLLIVTAALALRPVAAAAHRGDDRAVGAGAGGPPRGRAGGVPDEPRRLPAGDRGDGHGGHRPGGDAAMKTTGGGAAGWRRSSPRPPRRGRALRLRDARERDVDRLRPRAHRGARGPRRRWARRRCRARTR